MKKFIKYDSLTNHDANKSLEFLRHAGHLSTRGHITEKFHGANFSFIWNNESKDLQVASRFGILPNDGEGFYQAKNVVALLKENVLALAKHLNSDFQLFGELFGGSIQSEIKYGVEQSFIAFDLLIDGDYVYQEQLEDFCTMFKIPVAKSHGIYSFDELMAMNVEIESPFAKEHGVSSIIEGFVWKPVETQWFQKTPDEKIRVVIKYKSEKFKEKKASHETKVKKTFESKLGDFETVIDQYINTTRIDAVVSKVGEVSIKDFGKVLPLFTTDVLEDLQKDETIVDMVETKKYINLKCIALLRPYLQKMS